jgi:hypothetical protein
MRRKINKRKSRKRQRGGVLSTVVGAPLVYSNVGSWPGVVGYNNGNYYSNNTNPYLQTTNYISERGMMGGYTYPRFFSRKNSHRKRRRSSKKYGGGFPLLNDVRLGAEVASTNVQNMINTSTGNPSQVSALPYMNQFHK